MGASPLQAILLQKMMADIAARGGGGGAPGAGPGPGGPPGMPGMPPGMPPPAGIPAPGMEGQPGNGAPGGGGGMTVSSSADDQGDALSKELSVMRVADPGMVAREIDGINRKINALIAHTGSSLPGVALGLSKAMAGVQRALSEANKAHQAMAVAGPPLNNSALPPASMATGSGVPGQPGMGLQGPQGPPS